MPKITDDSRDPMKLELGKKLRVMKQENPEHLQKFLMSLTEKEAEEILFDQEIWARENQWVDLADGYPITLLLAARGMGKGFTAASTVKRAVEKHNVKNILILAPTARDFRANIAPAVIEMYPEGHLNRPYWSPAKASIVWENSGATAVCIPSSASEDSVRGLNTELCIADEMAFFENDIITQALLTLRKEPSKMIITTTPKATPMLIDFYNHGRKEDNGYVKLIRGTTYENLDNLSNTFKQSVINKYEGTTLGRQELEGELILESASALWSMKTIKDNTVEPTDIPKLVHVCIGVDPAVLQRIKKAKGERRPDDTAITVCGLGDDGLYYVLEGVSGSFSVEAWINKVVQYFEKYKAVCPTNIIMEINQHGQEMIEMAFKKSDYQNVLRYMIYKYATQSKLERAMPYSLMAQQHKIKYVPSEHMTDLELELTSYDGTGKSPNNLDSFVWAMKGLAPPAKQYTTSKEFMI